MNIMLRKSRKLLWPVLLLLGGLSLWATSPLAAFAAPADTLPPRLRTMCTTDTVPKGWVIVDSITDMNQCSPSVFNTHNVAVIAPPPTQAMDVCHSSPIPDGWVVVGEHAAVNLCVEGHPLFPMGAVLSIAPASGTDPMTICAPGVNGEKSSFPQGWVITGEINDIGSRGRCLSISDVLSIAPVTGSAITVCTSSPIPEGYSVQADTESITCTADNDSAVILGPSSTGAGGTF